jgi:hypothetical protein
MPVIATQAMDAAAMEEKEATSVLYLKFAYTVWVTR